MAVLPEIIKFAAYIVYAKNRTTLNRFINWISEHDHKKTFIILYIGLSLVLSIAISLFWLLFAVLVHFAFELVRQSRYKESKYLVFLESLWETKLDFALVIFAFWLAVYLDFIFGIAGIGAVARAGAQSASRVGSVGGKVAEASVRFAGWSRVIRAFLLSVDDLGNAAKAVYQSRRAKKSSGIKRDKDENEASENELTAPDKTSWTKKWAAIDYIGLGLLILFAILIVAAPWLIDMDFSEIWRIGMEEFHPFPL